MLSTANARTQTERSPAPTSIWRARSATPFQCSDLVSPMQLQWRARNPAAFLGLDHDLGRIAPGYRANLVLLDDRSEVEATWIDGVQFASLGAGGVQLSCSNPARTSVAHPFRARVHGRRRRRQAKVRVRRDRLGSRSACGRLTSRNPASRYSRITCGIIRALIALTCISST